MSYQALARKYRPRRFPDVVGQQHVVSALSNALENDRVHHALLFSGTRGVGKTTLARIFAKSLNCETKGVSADPCGTCSTCVSVDEGRFIDLLEVDAASKTKVDDTRELLDNVQYAPTQGQYKVYLIDEVHMLSKSSFAALLKTLEEPPEHVKFLLATTDPEKLPVTILSRCLQFNLRSLDVEEIAGQIRHIVGEESLSAEEGAVDVIARSANGSMRDALSLLDQAVAFSGGQLDETGVRTMLGMIDDVFVERLLLGLVSNDAKGLLDTVAEMSERSSDYVAAIDDLLLALHALALEAHLPGSLARAGRDTRLVEQLDNQLGPEEIQLFYQLALVAKRDLAMAPDPRSGFEMALLRILAYRPAATDAPAAAPTPPASGSGPAPASGGSGGGSGRGKFDSMRGKLGGGDAQAASAKATTQRTTPTPAATPAAAPAPASAPTAPDLAAAESPQAESGNAPRVPDAARVETPATPASRPASPADLRSKIGQAPPDKAPPPSKPSAEPSDMNPEANAAPEVPSEAPVAKTSNANADQTLAADEKSEAEEELAPLNVSAEQLMTTEGWATFIAKSQLGGMVGEMARNAVACEITDDIVVLKTESSVEQMRNTDREGMIASELSRALGRSVTVELRQDQPAEALTPAAEAIRAEKARQLAAEQTIHADPNVQALISRFGATIIADSIKPADAQAGDKT